MICKRIRRVSERKRENELVVHCCKSEHVAQQKKTKFCNRKNTSSFCGSSSSITPTTATSWALYFFRSPMTPVTRRVAMQCIAMRPIDRPTDACWKVSTAKTCQIFFMLINLKNTNTTNTTTNSRQYIVATKSECNRNSNTFCLELNENSKRRNIFIKSLCFQTSNNFICCAAGKRVRSRTHTFHWLLGDALFWSLLNY